MGASLLVLSPYAGILACESSHPKPSKQHSIDGSILMDLTVCCVDGQLLDRSYEDSKVIIRIKTRKNYK